MIAKLLLNLRIKELMGFSRLRNVKSIIVNHPKKTKLKPKKFHKSIKSQYTSPNLYKNSKRNKKR